jgi:hypothetical protein
VPLPPSIWKGVAGTSICNDPALFGFRDESSHLLHYWKRKAMYWDLLIGGFVALIAVMLYLDIRFHLRFHQLLDRGKYGL